ncbi:MAG: hypothetical protein DHS80DRAFT_24878 [Piptocephalis tieghemiana]|nr:MAG: hypothetical protein DHS80DRAFT_24878 [Piptocephalis tieghemiana]
MHFHLYLLLAAAATFPLVEPIPIIPKEIVGSLPPKVTVRTPHVNPNQAISTHELPNTAFSQRSLTHDTPESPRVNRPDHGNPGTVRVVNQGEDINTLTAEATTVRKKEYSNGLSEEMVQVLQRAKGRNDLTITDIFDMRNWNQNAELAGMKAKLYEPGLPVFKQGMQEVNDVDPMVGPASQIESRVYGPYATFYDPVTKMTLGSMAHFTGGARLKGKTPKRYPNYPNAPGTVSRDDVLLSLFNKMHGTDYTTLPKDATLNSNMGHLLRVGDLRGMAQTPEAMSLLSISVNRMDNITPQPIDFNGGIWNDLEDIVTALSDKFDDMWVVSGPVLKGHEGQVGPFEADSFYKVFLGKYPIKKGNKNTNTDTEYGYSLVAFEATKGDPSKGIPPQIYQRNLSNGPAANTKGLETLDLGFDLFPDALNGKKKVLNGSDNKKISLDQLLLTKENARKRNLKKA